MRQELTAVGFEELKSPEAVDQGDPPNSQGTTLLVLNSVCGCAAGTARPGVKLALNHGKKPSKLLTVLPDRTQPRLRLVVHGSPYPPSSPSIALFRMANWYTSSNATTSKAAARK